MKTPANTHPGYSHDTSQQKNKPPNAIISTQPNITTLE